MRLVQDDAASAPAAEQVSILLASRDVRIERIVSTGHASPPGFWYDQEWDEFVLLIGGSASLMIEGEAAPRSLGTGDYLLLPAHLRHRVEATAASAPTIWLAVHYRPAGAAE